MHVLNCSQVTRENVWKIGRNPSFWETQYFQNYLRQLVQKSMQQFQSQYLCFVEILGSYFLIYWRYKPSRSLMASSSRTPNIWPKICTFCSIRYGPWIIIYRETGLLEIPYLTVEKIFRLRARPISLAINNVDMFLFRVGNTYSALIYWTAIPAMGHNTMNIYKLLKDRCNIHKN